MTDQIDLSDLPLVETESALGGALSTEAPQGVPGLLDGLPRAVPEELRQQYRGLKEPPDQAAKVLKLSERTGIPDETVRNRIAEVERLANEPDWDEFEANAPRSAELMVKDLELFKLAHDVPEELSRFEQLVSQFKGGFYQAQAGDEISATARAASAGLLGAQQPLGPANLGEVAGPPRAPDSGPTRFIKGANDRMSQIMRDTGQNVDVMRARIGGFPGPEMGGDPEIRAATGRAVAETKIAEAIRNLTSARQQYQSPEVKAFVEAEGPGPALSVFAESPITTTLDLIATSGYPMLAAVGGAIAGGPAGWMGRAAGKYLSSYDLNYNARVVEALSDEGINPADPAAVAAALRDPALVRRVTQRAFRYATPIAAFDSLAAIAAGAKLASTPLREAAAQTTVQGVFGGVGEALGQVSDTGDIQSWGEVIAEGIAEIPGGVIEPGAYHLIDHLRGEQRVVDAEAFKNRVTELTELANQSKLRERSPQKFEQVIDGLLGENADADVYINAHEFSEFFQSQGINPMEIAGQLTGVAAQLPEAMVRNGDIRIKASEYITRLGHTEYQQGLNEIVRAQPEAMSAKEATEWKATQQERFQQLVEQIDAEHEADTAWNESAKQVEDFVRDQIVSTGRFTPEVAAKDAALHGAMAKVLASKMNLQPHQVYEQFGLRVAGAPVVQQDGMQYDQQTGAAPSEAPRILFEVAPDPNNAELTERWNALTPVQRFTTSRRVAEVLLPKVLAEFAVQGDLTVQVGGYQGATNPALALTIPNGAIAGQVARVLGYVLNQDSMVALAGEPFDGGAPVGAVTVTLPEGFGEEQIRGLYDRLWQLRGTDGNPLVGGFAAANGQMLILNFSGIDDAQFAAAIDGFLGGEYNVKLDTVHAAFIDREEYGYGSGRSSGQASARKPSRTRWADSLRAEATDLLEQSLAGPGGTFFQGLAPAEGAGPAQRGAGRVSTPTVREDGRVELTHWSRVSGLQALDPSKYGTGIAGAEKRRKMNNPGAWVDRTYYGLSVGQDGGYRREASLGRQRYTASIEPERLYDLANDPDGLFAGDLTEYEKAIRDAGYAGYWVNNPSLGLTAAVFEALPVEAHVDESPARYGQDPVDLPFTIPDDDPMLRETVDLPGREALREQIVGSILANGRPVEGRKPVVWVMGGGGGAGKGTILNRLQEIGELRPDGVVHIDPDGIKALIPEYQQILALGDSRAAAVVHEESSLLRKQAEAGAIAMRTDMVLDVTLGNPAKGVATLRQLKDAGYEIRLVGVTTPTQIAVERAVARGKNSGRYVVLDELVKAHRGFSAGFEQYAALADDVRLFDNSGRLPALIYTKGDIVNPDLYNRFLEKANETDQAVQPQPAPADRAGPVQQRGGGPQAPGEVPGAGAGQQAPDPGAVPGQRLSQQARGSIQFPADLTQAPSVINLLDGADLSTFLHETGHFFFEVYRTVASQPGAPESVVADMQALLEFVGVADLATWNSMSIEQRRDGHEKVARAFEAYLFEGKAPSPALTDLFRTFSRWLVNVYKSLRGLNVDLTPEVRGVFDRMLATEEEIKAVETLRQYAPLFESMEQAGMSLQDWAEYQALGQAATDAADSELQHRSLKDMRWLSNAKARELKRLQREADAKRRDVRTEAEAAIYATPIYAARRYLTHGDIEPPTPNQRARRLAEQLALEPGKLSKTALLQMYGDGPAAPWRYLSTGKYGLMAQEGIHPDELAELFGFDSGDALVRQLLEVPDPEAAIDARTDQMMLERYGDITSPAVLDHLADMAVHNEARLRFLNTELRALDQMMNARGDTGRVDARGRKISYNILEQAAREFAAQAIGRKKVRDAGKTGAYAAAETRAGKAAMDAMRKGDIQSAAEHKRAQVLNAHFFRAASKAGEEIDKIVRYLKKFDSEGTRKNLDRGYLDQIDQLLERVDLRKAPQGEVERRRKLAEWVAEQEEKGFAPAIDPALIDEARLTHYTNLTMDELRALRDAVKSIEHLGRLKKKLLTARDKREFDEVIEAAVASIEQNSRGVRPVEIETDLPQNRLRQGIGQFFASHRKIAEIFRQMDGDQDGGAMWSLLMQPLNEAMDREAVMKEEATVALSKLFLGLKRGGRLYQKEFIPEINASLTKMGRIAVALNLGNDTNRARLNQGYGWTPQQIDAITRTLTKEDWDFVQGVWDLIDSYWPMIEAKELRVNGVAPEKVQAVPVVTPFGEYRGGYYPIRYDIEQSPKAHQDATAEAAKQAMRGARARATTRRGHLEQRVEEVKRPLSLSFSTIFEHLEQVIHDVAMHEFLIDQARVLNDKRMQDAIVRHYGAEIYRQLTNAMTAVAAGDVPATLAHERVANWLRTGASIAAMGWKLTTAMVQPLGLTQSMQRIGPKWVFKGIGRAFTDAAHLESSYAWIAEKSPMMRLRGKTLQREINEIRNRIEKEGWFQDQLNKVARVVGAEQAPDVKNSYFWLIVKLQLLADVPTWIGQYEKSRAAGESEERAVALADQAVLDAQGGGQIKDLAAVQRGHPWWKLWTNFYSFFNTTYNRTHAAVSRTRWKNPASVGRLAVDMLLLYALPAALSTLLYELWRNECDGDEECLVRKIAKDQVTYALGTVVGLRELQAMFQPYGYGGPAGARAISEITKLGQQAAQGEIDEAFLRAANKAGGILFHYPAGQIDATARGVTALATGETERITAIGFGPPVNE